MESQLADFIFLALDKRYTESALPPAVSRVDAFDACDLAKLNSFAWLSLLVGFLVGGVDFEVLGFGEDDKLLTPLLEDLLLLVQVAAQVPLLDHVFAQLEGTDQLSAELAHVFSTYDVKLPIGVRVTETGCCCSCGCRSLRLKDSTLLDVTINDLEVVILRDANVLVRPVFLPLQEESLIG